MVKQLGPMLVEDARASCGYGLAGISPGETVQIAAGFAAGNWPPDAGRLPWAPRPIPGESAREPGTARPCYPTRRRIELLFDPRK